MKARLTGVSLVLWLSAAVLFSQQASQEPDTNRAAVAVDFQTEVAPILEGACYQCHSGSLPQGRLRLDVRSMAFEGGISGPAILAGNSEQSLLLHRIRGEGGLDRMPLGGTPLTPAETNTLARWIEQGALWPDALANEDDVTIERHWAYLNPIRQTIPEVQDTAWVQNPIDSFVLARLEEEGLAPSPEADRETLIRRLSLDLIGLPPDIPEIDAFASDTRPDAYDRVVERLLASPHYGERWATPWLDLARYADSDGYEKDSPRVSWPYRDWVVQAFNQNMPFDQFAIEQLAGDLLPDATSEQKVATGFARASMLNTEAGTDPEEQHWVAQLDRAATVGTVFLGSTIACTQCHDHPYDPFTQRQFYEMVAFFNNGDFEPGQRTIAEPRLDLPTPEQASSRSTINAGIEILEAQIENWPDAARLQADWERELLEAENDWLGLVPTRLASTGGSSLTAIEQDLILATGELAGRETYIVEARSPSVGEITGVRLEALPHSSLPMQGPGRDYYGNFSLSDVEVAIVSSDGQTMEVLLSETPTDAPSPRSLDGVNNVPQLWTAKAGEGERLRRQLLLIPQEPFNADRDSVLRIRIDHQSEVSGQLLGHFRVSVTRSDDPLRVIDIPYDLRPVLSMSSEERNGEEPGNEQQRGGGSPGARLTDHWQTVAKELSPVRQRIEELENRIAALEIPSTLVLSEDLSVTHPVTNMRIRGNFMSPGQEVAAGVPAFLGLMPTEAPPNRLGLARWLVSSGNPLTARVRMNQIWQTYFGIGIVETSEDFGTQGGRPSHPELLDWLAVEFMDSGWNQKAIHRLIVTSNTYRQSSRLTPELRERDPRNILLARGARFRAEAEMVRDIALGASGLLSPRLGGPPVMPYQPDGLWVFPFQAPEDQWILSEGEDRYRRALYTFVRRTARYPSMVVFDAPSRESSVARRPVTNTPLQALTTLNDPAFFEAAPAMARRILVQGGPDVPSRAEFGFRLATSRRPQTEEMDSLLTAFEEELDYFERNPGEAEALVGEPDPALAAWTLMSNVLLNLDEALTKE